MRIYLVGGAVRDELLGISPGDRDFVVVGGNENDLLARFPHAKKVGRGNQWTWLIDGEEYTLSDAATIEEDLATRDLTVNAMARDESGDLIALPGALDDLSQRILRPVNADNFLRDPNRVFRAARFASAWPEFTPSVELMQVMRRTAAETDLGLISAERVGAETRKAAAGAAPARYAALLHEAGALAPWLVELETAFEPTLAGLACLCREHETVGWMGICRHLDPESAGRLGRRLKLPSRLVAAGELAPALAPDLARYPHLPPERRLDILVRLNASQATEHALRLVQAQDRAEAAPRVMDDLRTIRQVRLPPTERDKGPESGRILRELRIRALSG